MAVAHVPVLVEELVACLNIRPDGIYVDGTFGSGGHAKAVLERLGPKGTLIACDRDPQAAGCHHADFAEVGALLKREGYARADGIYVDLGLSSMQLAEAGRGFSFMKEGPLDMRMDTTKGETLKQKLSRTNEWELANILQTYGEERSAKKIARVIMEKKKKGKLETTRDLAEAVLEVSPQKSGPWRIHPATRTFQALRIWVNEELENLQQFLSQAPHLLNAGGRLCVIAYHSLEDRMVKRAFRRLAKEEEGFALITKKPIRPSPAEIQRNPRARSARLRCLTKN
ncbi:MAG: 16S rRNA (cytosine(1402)-N(4))-methyltransferase RsmH [Deltaproteobacteria bacterium]|nr:16S rRNA (cytosine(1402)-N(4))-methyltransferase RsmH [Deltaproteobacteria bacterium]MBI4224689.1 16S rRNA (cytosine(1402)-N(4))-methyltransferase RsmH [Deltaproteobacteria bacterium]